MKNTLIAIMAILLPMISAAQKGHHFEFNYFALELGSTHCLNIEPEPCMNFYFHNEEGKVHMIPAKGQYYTPGFNAGLQFHHDFQNDKAGLVIGATLHSYGYTSKYQSESKAITLTETQRAMALGIPVYLKLGSEIYNNQCYFFMGTQIDINMKLITSQKASGMNGTHRTDAYKDALQKVSVPIIIGFNYNIINIKIGVRPKSFMNPDYEIPVGDGELIKPFAGSPKLTVFGNFGFLIPLSQWTTRRCYILSRIF